jgi:hypothetical protein
MHAAAAAHSRTGRRCDDLAEKDVVLEFTGPVHRGDYAGTSERSNGRMKSWSAAPLSWSFE